MDDDGHGARHGDRVYDERCWCVLNGEYVFGPGSGVRAHGPKVDARFGAELLEGRVRRPPGEGEHVGRDPPNGVNGHWRFRQDALHGGHALVPAHAGAHGQTDDRADAAAGDLRERLRSPPAEQSLVAVEDGSDRANEQRAAHAAAGEAQSGAM